MDGQHPAVAIASQVTQLLDAAKQTGLRRESRFDDRQAWLIKRVSDLSDVVSSVDPMNGQHPAVAIASQVTRLLDAAKETGLRRESRIDDRQACLIEVGSGFCRTLSLAWIARTDSTRRSR